MADNLWARLTQGTDDPVNRPNIGKHAFFCALREYARGRKSAGDIRGNYNVEVTDPGAIELLGLIDAETGEDAKIKKVREIEDLLSIHEGDDSNPLYPDKASIATRLGL